MLLTRPANALILSHGLMPASGLAALSISLSQTMYLVGHSRRKWGGIMWEMSSSSTLSTTFPVACWEASAGWSFTAVAVLSFSFSLSFSLAPPSCLLLRESFSGSHRGEMDGAGGREASETVGDCATISAPPAPPLLLRRLAAARFSASTLLAPPAALPPVWCRPCCGPPDSRGVAVLTPDGVWAGRPSMLAVHGTLHGRGKEQLSPSRAAARSYLAARRVDGVGGMTR
mmetsp:Transcript_483/g.1043  ORF Transcript_483/g.1043 Transcript_483/m.1043 type:complete len:229 (+) Transcript_483:103-789(+)